MTFGALLRKHMERHDLSCAAFARSIGVKPPLIFAVRSGKQKIPKTRIEKWADALSLRGAERTEFIETAWLSHAPAYVQELVARLRRAASRATK